jgi:hypothetical protein
MTTNTAGKRQRSTGQGVAATVEPISMERFREEIVHDYES